MAMRRNGQVGFRDDTSYIAAHYGGRKIRQPAPGSSNAGPDDTAQRTTPPASRTQTTPTQPADTTRQHLHGVAVKESLSQKEVRRSIANGASVRPTLSEQLATIGKAAEDITAGIRQSYGLKLEGAMLTVPSESFFVGRLRCKYPSPVHFFTHKCVYIFHHPFEATRITMEMFFRDMRCAILDLPRRQLRFKIDHPLCHYGRDYCHEDPSHFVVVQFSSDFDSKRVTEKVMPLIRSACGARGRKPR